MKIISRRVLSNFLRIGFTAGVFLLAASPAVAAESHGNWRATYDLVMMWLNFIIFVGVGVKFARQPIKNFLQGRREEIARELKMLETEKEQITARVHEALNALEESDIRFEKVKQRIIAEGEARKQQIIEKAHQESRLLLQQAKVRIQHNIQEAGRQLKSELIDIAFEQALQRLPAVLTPEDHERLTARFVEEAFSK